jgi:hypothetical protein
MISQHDLNELRYRIQSEEPEPIKAPASWLWNADGSLNKRAAQAEDEFFARQEAQERAALDAINTVTALARKYGLLDDSKAVAELRKAA